MIDMKKKNMNGRLPLVAKIAILVGLFLMVLVAAAPAAAQSETVSGQEYLQGIGADNAQREHIVEVLYG